MTFTLRNRVAIGLVAAGSVGLAGTTLIARSGPVFEPSPVPQQAAARHPLFVLATAATTTDQLTAGELDVRLQYAEERLRLTLQMSASGQLSALDVTAAREEAAVLRSLIDAQAERLEDAIQLLRIEKDVRQAELHQARAAVTNLAILKQSTERLRQTGAVAAGEVALAEAKLAAVQGESLEQQARIREIDTRIEQAARRLERLEALQARKPADEPTAPDPDPTSVPTPTNRAPEGR